ncbi:MAG: Fe-S-cluster containining protein [Planctomycetota bacterium]|jgi:Fe-S-cluster containining protein
MALPKLVQFCAILRFAGTAAHATSPADSAIKIAQHILSNRPPTCGYRTPPDLSELMNHNPWYEKGLRFECQGSGNCCVNHGDYSYVYLTDTEVEGLAGQLEVTTAEFLSKWCRIEDGWTVLRMDQPDCPFLTKERRCGVYPARPKQCSTWPFWTENLTAENWQKTVVSLCPGVGKGRLFSKDEIEEIAGENDANVDA